MSFKEYATRTRCALARHWCAARCFCTSRILRRGAQRFACGGWRASSVFALELPVEPLEHARGPVVGAQPQQPAPGVGDHARGHEHHLLDHRLQAPAFGSVTQRRNLARQRVLGWPLNRATLEAEDEPTMCHRSARPHDETHQ